MKRAISVDELYKMKFKMMEFEGKWLEFIGKPEMSGVWFIWGNSGNGKTRLQLELAKYLCEFGRVAYNTMEEGARYSFQKAAMETNMKPVGKKFIVIPNETIDELRIRLQKRKSPDVIFIDSFQYTCLNKDEYIRLKRDFPNKLFIFSSHAQGKDPKGSVADFARYDADVKIRVEGYKAFPVSRYGGRTPLVIWELGAADYWGEDLEEY